MMVAIDSKRVQALEQLKAYWVQESEGSASMEESLV
jgi:hypothetical protein